MHKILIPTDFSANSFNAAKYAAELFKYGPSEIHILHAYAEEIYDLETELNPEEYDMYQNEVANRSISELGKFQKDLIAIYSNPKHKVFTVSIFGLLIEAVNDLVEKENIDIVVMGTKGKTADKKMTFGSNTVQVMKYVRCPVLAIPEVHKDVHPKNILFPTDFYVPQRRRELKLLCTIAKGFAAKINLLYVSDEKELTKRQQNNKEFMEASMENSRLFFLQIPENDITESINTYLQGNPIDMLVMVNTRHSYLENILYQSTIEKIGLHIDIPFLVFQNLARQ